MTSQQSNITLSAMPTPNPNTIKFLPNLEFFDSGSIDFPDASKAKGSALPEALFEIDEVTGVMVGFNFVSVSKSEDASWEETLEEIRDTILSVLEDESEYIDKSLLDEASKAAEYNSELDIKIKKILDEEIRPAIAMDGGDLEYRGFEDGIVTLKLQGACSTCPASTMTLKMGIESRLKEEFPEVKEVVQEGINF